MISRVFRALQLLERPLLHRFTVVVFLSFFGAVCELLGLGLVLPLIIILMQGDFSTFGLGLLHFEVSSSNNIGVILLIVICAIFSARGLLLLVVFRKQSLLVASIKHYFTMELIRSYVYRDYLEFGRTDNSIKSHNILAEIPILISYIYKGLIFIAIDSFSIVLLVFLIFFVEPLGSVLAFGLVALGVALFYFGIRSKMRMLGIARARAESDRTTTVLEGLSGFKENIINQTLSTFLLNSDLNSKNACQVEAKQFYISQLPRIGLEVLGILVIVFIGVVSYFSQESIEGTISSLAVVAGAAFRILPSLNRLIVSFQSLQYGKASLDTIEFELGRRASQRAFQYKQLIPNDEKIEKVSIVGGVFRYGVDSVVLRDVNFEAEFGVVVGIQGPSGSGKSTLLDSLMGLFLPAEGYIEVNDRYKNARLYLESPRRVGYVPQIVYIWPGSLGENITLDQTFCTADRERLDSCVEAASLNDMLEEGGEAYLRAIASSSISGGQRQRIGIARSLYSDADILVLDEFTSSLDSKSEAKVLSSVRKIAANKIVIIVSHQPAALEICDVLYEIDGHCLKRKR